MGLLERIFGNKEKEIIIAQYRQIRADIEARANKYVSENNIDVPSEIEKIGKICNLGTPFSGESNYKAVGLILISTFPPECIPWIVRNFPRPHGGLVLRALTEIDNPPKDAVINVILNYDVIKKYPGLEEFLPKKYGKGFLAKSGVRTQKAAMAWVHWLLTQDNIDEARNLWRRVAKISSISPQIIEELLPMSLKLGKYLFT